MIDGLEAAARPYVVWDTDTPGFGVRVGPDSKSHIFRYRLRQLGRAVAPRTITLGRHGAITPHQARDMAEKLSHQVRTDGDPARERPTHLKALTVKRFGELDLKGPERRGRKGIDDVRSLLKCHLYPTLGRLSVAEVTKADVVELKEKLERQPRKRKDGTLISPGKPRQAGRVVEVLRAMFNCAEREEKPWQRMRPKTPIPATRSRTTTEARGAGATCDPTRSAVGWRRCW